jgi:hypothetical protein
MIWETSAIIIFFLWKRRKRETYGVRNTYLTAQKEVNDRPTDRIVLVL